MNETTSVLPTIAILISILSLISSVSTFIYIYFPHKKEERKYKTKFNCFKIIVLDKVETIEKFTYDVNCVLKKTSTDYDFINYKFLENSPTYDQRLEEIEEKYKELCKNYSSILGFSKDLHDNIYSATENYYDSVCKMISFLEATSRLDDNMRDKKKASEEYINAHYKKLTQKFMDLILKKILNFDLQSYEKK